MAARRTLDLTPAQRAELEAGRDHDPRPYLRECCAALLKIADGQTPHHVARHGLHKARDPDTVYRWLTVYAREGLAGLVHRPRGHRGFSPSGRCRGGADRAAGAAPARPDAPSLAAG